MNINIEYWHEDLRQFLYIPLGELKTYEQLGMLGVSQNEIATCRMWWNTNIPLERFSPTIIPIPHFDTDLSKEYVDEDVAKEYIIEQAVEAFARRLRQRIEGKEVPLTPELKLTGSPIITYERINDHGKPKLRFKSLFCALPNEETLCRISLDGAVIETDVYDINEVIQRDPTLFYWDAYAKRYI